jgi:hypothetical protein
MVVNRPARKSAMEANRCSGGEYEPASATVEVGSGSRAARILSPARGSSTPPVAFDEAPDSICIVASTVTFSLSRPD